MAPETPKARHSHYDIAMVKRAAAIGRGAVAITVRELAYMSVNRDWQFPDAPLVTAEQGKTILAGRRSLFLVGTGEAL